MKDDRFIELVNLYIDRQISAEEVAALEAEMQANPRRRAVYRQYCQMHRATTLVYESFRNESAETGIEPVGAKENLTRFTPEPSNRRTPWLYYTAGLAAACVALVFAHFNGKKDAAPTIATTTLPAKQTIAAIPVPVKIEPVVVAATPAIPVAVRDNPLIDQRDYAAMLAAMRKEEQRAFANGQIQRNRTSSLFEDGIFDPQPAGTSNGFRSKPTSSQQAEFAAFQFQR